jgi:co-chaperonin GroES (HSP10)
MSKTYLEPATDHILVVDGSQVTTIDGIDMPDNAKQKDMLAGSVVFIGPDARHTQLADTVLYGPYAGKSVVVDGMEFRLLREGQIEAYLRKSN